MYVHKKISIITSTKCSVSKQIMPLFNDKKKLHTAKPSRTLLQRLHEENQLWFSNSKHFRFYWKKKHFISELYFTKNHEIGSLVVRKVKKSGDSRQNRELGPAWESKSNCRSFHHYLSPGRVKNLQKFINFCLKVGHSSKLKHSKSTWRPWNVQNQHIEKWEQSTAVVVLISGAFVWTQHIYIWVTHLHIAVPTLTCSLCYV